MKFGKIFLIIISVVLLFTSCKDVPQEVVGTWTYQTFDDSPQGTMNWTFKDDGSLVRVLTNGTGISFDSCTYAVDKSFLKTQINISGSKSLSGYTDINGAYRIDKLKDDILIMTRIRMSDDESNGAYLRCEMIRKM